MEKQLAIVVNTDRCIGCWACALACRQEHELSPGLLWNRVVETSRGHFPNVEMKYFPVMCQHCQDAPCMKACPGEALYRRQDGIVLVNKEKCGGCEVCNLACPAGCRPRGYAGLIAEGRFEEALEVIRETIPFSAVCGRVCKHPCELQCRRSQVDEPVAIAALKRFVADWERNNGGIKVAPAPRTREEKIAVVGSGPAGLTAAADLVKLGYGVTVLEALPVAGGMMRVGIRPDRLPKDILQQEIDALVRLGVEIKTNARLGTDFTLGNLLNNGYQAVFVATGAHQSRALRVDGESLPGVVDAIELLRKINLGQAPQLGQRVIVVGGGDVAMDAARSVLRLGRRQVDVVCLESLKDMPADKDEVSEAIEEGAKVHPDLGIKRILGRDGAVAGIETITVRSVFDASGKFNPSFIPNTERSMVADTVILAVGQVPDLSFLKGDDGIEVRPGGFIAVDRQTLATTRRGVFAGGDVAGLGPMNVVEAIAAGHKVARSIATYLGNGESVPAAKAEAKALATPVDKSKVTAEPRQEMPTLPVSQRLKGFAEYKLGLTQASAVAEAKRCLGCSACVQACPYQALVIDHVKGTLGKCNLCVHRVDVGGTPACVVACRTDALCFGDINDPESKAGRLTTDKRSFVLLPQKETKPSMHYLERLAKVRDWLSKRPFPKDSSKA